MSDTTPSLGGVIGAGISARLAAVRVALPAMVLSYDSATCKAAVQPTVYESYVDETGATVTEAAPVINDVPVVMPGSGGVRVKFPIAAGDTVLLVFASSNIDRWLSLGGAHPPADMRHHDIADAIAIPGLQSFADAADATPMIEFTAGGAIEAGGSSALALKSDVDNLRTLVGAINTGAPGPLVNTLGPAWAATATVGTTILKGA